MTAADWQAIAECVTAIAAVSALAWVKGLPATARAWFVARARRQALTLVSREVAALPRIEFNPDVSLEAGIAYAREAARSGHPPYTVTQGRATSEQPLDYLLAKTAEVVWEAVTAAHSELEPYLVPVRNYMTALAAKAGLSPARDFGLGVLTERVRQEEYGWPDHPGDHRGLRTAHGTGASHLCLLERKHEVEGAIYRVVEGA